jgi:hypothetical protein
MKNKYILPANSWLLILVLSAFLSGCKREEINCQDPSFDLRFIGYTKSEIDTIVIRKFQLGDNYQHLIDTVLIRIDSQSLYRVVKDTMTRWIGFSRDEMLAAYDWQLNIPANGKTVSIAAISLVKTTGKCRSGFGWMDKAPCGCSNPMYSFKVDNQVINLSEKEARNPILYIHH